MDKVSEIMEKKFLYFHSEDTLAYAAKKLDEANLSEAPVLRNERFIGMLSTSDIAAALVKEGLFHKPEQLEAKKVRNELVSKHVKSPWPHLKQDSDILSALLLLVHRNVDCIPVLDKDGKVLGVVFARDIRKEMAKWMSAQGKLPSRSADEVYEEGSNHTTIDQILHYVKKKGIATSDEVAKRFNLPVDEVEEYAQVLEKNKLLSIEYDIFGKTKLKKVS